MARNEKNPISTADKAESSLLEGRQLEGELYRSADNSAFYTQISQYMFWVATTIAAAVIGSVAFTTGAALSPWALGLMGMLSVGTMVGSLSYSRAAARETQRNDTLYSVRQAEDNTHQLVNALEQKAKEHVMLKDALKRPEEAKEQAPAASQPFERQYDLSDKDTQRHVAIKGENKPERSWVAVAGKSHSRSGASQQWAEYVAATQNVALARDL